MVNKDDYIVRELRASAPGWRKSLVLSTANRFLQMKL